MPSSPRRVRIATGARAPRPAAPVAAPLAAPVAAPLAACLVALGCSGATGPSGPAPVPSSQPVVTASSSPTPAPSAAPTTAPNVGPVPLSFEAKRLGGVFLGGDPPSVLFLDSTSFVVETSGVAELCDLASWKSVRALPTGLEGWTAAANGKLLAALDDDEAVLVDPATGNERGRLSVGAGSIALSADGASLVVVSATAFDRFKGSVWSTAAGTASPKRRVDGTQAVPGTLGAVLAPDKVAFLASATPTGPQLFVESQPPQRLDLEPPTRFTFAPDGAAAVVSGRKEDKVIVVVLELPTGRERVRFEVPPPAVQASDAAPPHVRSLSVSNNASRVALTVGPANGPGALVVFDGKTAAPLARHDQPKEESLEASTLLIAPDGKHTLWIRRAAPTTPTDSTTKSRPRPHEIALATLP